MPFNKADYENDYELLYLVSENDEEANNILYKKYESVIDHYVRKYMPLTVGKGIEYNDLFQEGLIGLDSAINNYSDQKDIKFSTFAFMCIERRIISAIKLANRQKHKALNESFSYDNSLEDGQSSLENLLSTGHNEIEDFLVNKERTELFNKRVLSDLAKSELEIFNLRKNGFSNDEIASILNRTPKAIGSSMARIRIKIKKILDEIN